MNASSTNATRNRNLSAAEERFQADVAEAQAAYAGTEQEFVAYLVRLDQRITEQQAALGIA